MVAAPLGEQGDRKGQNEKGQDAHFTTDFIRFPFGRKSANF
jgi:hypothetical protein